MKLCFGLAAEIACETWARRSFGKVMIKTGKFGLKLAMLAATLVVVLVVFSAPGMAQTSSFRTTASAVLSADAGSDFASEPDPNDTVLTIRKRVDEVNVLFIATDRHGKFVRNLNQKDFAFTDDHKPVQSIIAFRPETDLPIELGLLMDVSGSVQGRFQFEKDAATGFLQHMIRQGYDKAFVVGFNKESHLAQDFTDNLPALSAGIQRMRDGGGTALYDAIYKACKEKLLHERPDHPIRKAIVVVSDGEDNQSEVTRGQAIEMAERAEVLIYAISTDDSGLILRGDRVLEDLATATGGRAFFPYKMKDITKSFAAIEDELRSQYDVSYKPADFDADGRFRSIQITALKKDLQVRARRGYFAPKQ
ncbi:MAG TPA: VWA domain-containing protein [Terriglobales bacterium]|nr:VWA domain-containing protein [Terriglobales bacterium]